MLKTCTNTYFWMLICVAIMGLTSGLQEISEACPDHNFFDGVDIDCIDTWGAPDAILRVRARSIIDYKLNSTILEDRGVDGDHVPLLTVDVLASAADDYSDPTQYVNVQSPAGDEYVDKLIGIALDGIPIYTAVGPGGYDMIAGNPSQGIEPIMVDECGGTYGPTPDGTRYHYRTIPACVLPLAAHSTRSNDTAVRIWNASEYTYNYGYDVRRKQYVTDIEQLLEGFTGTPGEKYPQIIGWVATGHPIYSPYNERGLLHSNLDNCNGKFDSEGNYGYYTKQTFPYILGCHGPGVYDLEDEGIFSREWAPGATKQHRKWNACPRGHIPGSAFESDGGCEACAAGRYSSSSDSLAWRRQQGGASSDIVSPQRETLMHGGDKQGCNNVCPEGHYCPEASVSPTRCPSGRYGSRMGLQDSACSGACTPGYYCPASTVNSRPNVYPCGGTHLYCPAESSFPLLADIGFYTTPEGIDGKHRENQTKCEPGWYCVDGVRAQCPAGRYGTGEGISDSNCTAECPSGSYCPQGSPDPIACPAGTYGASPGLSDKACSGLCQPGHYCPAGSTATNQTRCRAGIYGAEEGLTNSQCSPVCEPEGSGGPNATSSRGDGRFCDVRHCWAGYFCREASISPRNANCGNASVYCPPSSSYPTPVDPGYYTVGPVSSPGEMQQAEDGPFRFHQVLCERGHYCVHGVKYECPQGYYGVDEGLIDPLCSGTCDPGYICSVASPSPTQQVCGTDASVYCPEGSYENITVPDGYYSVGHDITTRQSIQACDPGHWCSGGIQRICAAGRYSSSGSSTEDCDGLCDRGYYCPEGSTSPAQEDCPAGRYGHLGMTTAACKGSCLAGYYCPVNSFSATQIECGEENYYCPHGSGDRIAVDSGYFSAGGNETTRVEQVPCIDADAVLSAYHGRPPASNSRVSQCPDTTVP